MAVQNRQHQPVYDNSLSTTVCMENEIYVGTGFATNLTVDQAIPAVELSNTAAGNTVPSGLAGTKFDRLGVFYYRC